MGEWTPEDASERLRKLRLEGIPPQVREELEKFKGVFPGENCLTHEELTDLQHNHTVEQEAKYLLQRIQHVIGCEFCRGFLEVCDPESIIKVMSRPDNPIPENTKNSVIEYYKNDVLPAHKCLSFSELEALQNNRQVAMKAMHVVAKTWHVSKCDSCKTLLSGAGLL